MRLRDRIALVTAGGSGMGRAACLRFAEEGAHVVVTDLDADAARATVAAIEAVGGSAEARQLNVAETAAVATVAEEIRARHGVLHVLYNHAGIPGASGIDISEDAFDLAIDVNLKGAFFLTAQCEDLLRAADGRASVIFTASVSGIVGSPLSPLYSMTKGGVVLLMKSLALKFGPLGIRVNAICPGPIATTMLPQFFGRDSDADVSDLIQGFTANVPLGRTGRAEEIANAALFLASDEASFITGVALPVDGGYLAR
ncbi:NAD(P)-dependent dehydrogenase (short-subunit alcohol dehydrogenase family) [Jatrophihabitans sp. GAS493]|uniref:SDR family NAD(P)-dependent oxidoreductase n=1 Tax=Jatrophihabitans sp. GAS493 TaxID=1907575 RepID=UPI000BB80754|nr:glucose 1-dehydrogenase [Jatrophihabitans sp. GAS493]SOD71799.1 NAD(P)-dependent dehydrogenase (short-subunit alcohol dehydrogenase family) [Jatrophihabitans sp. GAS493]